MTARSLRGSAAMISASEHLAVGRANDQLARSFHDVVHRDDLSAVADHHARAEIKRDQVDGSAIRAGAPVEQESPLWLARIQWMSSTADGQSLLGVVRP